MSLTKLSESAVLSGLSKVPPFPPIAARLLVLLANESVDLGEVADLVGSDPTFSARVLQCVNSVEFGLAQPIRDVRGALTFLGLDQTRQAIVILATRSYSKGPLGTDALRRCWEHTVATAILADQLARASQAYTDVAFTAGIIHDIGRLGLLVAYPREYESIIRDAAERCCDLLDFESEQFGVHHAEAGRILSERWGLPEEFRIIAGRHHDRLAGEALDLLRIVHLACRLADVLGYEITHPLVSEKIDDILAELPDFVRKRLHGDPDQLRTRIEQRIRIYDKLDEGNAGESSSPDEEIAPGDQVVGEPAQVLGTSPALVDSRSIVSRIGAPIASALLTALVVLLVAAFLLLRRW
jgi:HD-like signal output (HDOD) protein